MIGSVDTPGAAERLERAMRHRDTLPALGASAQSRVAPCTRDPYDERAAAFLRDVAGL